MKDIRFQYREPPLVSIIVPLYNAERYLAQCVESLLRQTLKDIEIILVDNGSIDNSPIMCDAYEEQDMRIRVIHQAGVGYGKACNAGINVAMADFFGIIESDDYVEPEMFERLYEQAKFHNLDVIRCHYYRYNSRVNTHERVDLSYIPKNTVCTPRDMLSVFNQAPAVWSMLYRKNFILQNKIRFLETPGASYQDTSFVFKTFACSERFMLLDDTFVHYRVDNENSSTLSKEKVFCVCDEYKEIERFINEKYLKDSLLPIVIKMKFLTYIWNYRRVAKTNRWGFLKQFAKEMRIHIFAKNIMGDIFSFGDIFKIYIIAFFYLPFYIIDTVKCLLFF